MAKELKLIATPPEVRAWSTPTGRVPPQRPQLDPRAAAKPNAARPEVSWAIYRIRSTPAEFLGTVAAPDAKIFRNGD